MLLPLVLLAGCQTTPTTSTDDVCLIWSPIDYHAKSDTPDTVDRIRTNNAKRDKYCGG